MSSRPEIVQGWKNIATYIDRDVSTAKRWERDRGLPVRRTPGSGRANVYALTAELARWLGAAEPESLADRAAESSAGTAQEEPPVAVASTARHSGLLDFGRMGVLAASVTLTALVCIVAFSVMRSRAARSGHSENMASASGYVSPVAGVQDLYLRGKYLYEQRAPDTLRLALQCFQQATAKDPDDAPAWAGMADAYLLLNEYDMMPLDGAYPALVAAANHALALDPAAGEPHSTLGYADFFWKLDVPAAEREFALADRLDRSSATVHSRYGSMLTYEARFDEALAQLRLAQRLDPQSTAVLVNLAFALGFSGHRDQAVALLEQTGYNERNASVIHHIGVLSELKPRNMPLYLKQFEKLSEFRHDDYEKQAYEAAQQTFRESGERAVWRALLVSNERLVLQLGVGMNIPRYEALLGENDKALTDLGRMVRAHNGGVAGILIDPAFLDLHADPRFARLVRQAGLPTPESHAVTESSLYPSR